MRTLCTASSTDYDLLFEHWCTQRCPTRSDREAVEAADYFEATAENEKMMDVKPNQAPAREPDLRTQIENLQSEVISCKTILRNAKRIRAARI
jgi:hypothetical protein